MRKKADDEPCIRGHAANWYRYATGTRRYRKCRSCENEARRKGPAPSKPRILCAAHGRNQCRTCYARAYRSKPAGRRHHNDAVIRYNAAHPAQHLKWRHRWQERIGIRVPDLQDLRAAINRLEAAVAEADQYSGVRGSD